MRTIIQKGCGFHVGQNFARARDNEVIELTDQYAGGPRYAIGFIAARHDSELQFMRYGKDGKIRVQVDRSTLKAIE